MPSRTRSIRRDAIPAATIVLAALATALLYAAFLGRVLAGSPNSAAPYQSILVEHGWSTGDGRTATRLAGASETIGE
jgi:hypothetical protein